MTDDMHVDLYHLDWQAGRKQFMRRLLLDDPLLVAAENWPSYVSVSEPHTMADCPEDT
jgi:hypothetical protein